MPSCKLSLHGGIAQLRPTTALHRQSRLLRWHRIACCLPDRICALVLSQVALTRKDEYGRILTPKEAFRQLCYR